jgi:arylsulfatase A-like enzyme
MFRAVIVGVAYGLCAAVADNVLGGRHWLQLNMPPLTGLSIQASLWMMALGALLGLALSPLRLFRKGWFVHAVGIVAVWIALARFVALDPAIVPSWLMAPGLGFVALGIGAVIARKSEVAAWGLGFAALAAAIAMPVVVDARREQPAVARPKGTPPSGAPDVVLVVLDTVRAANVSAYGYGRATMPTFDRLSREGALFLDATSPSTWSLPSHASLFSGLFPSGHGAHGENRVLAPDVPTLAEVLGRNGYETQCFTANPHISDSFGLTRGFQHQDRAWAGPGAGQSFRFIYRVLDLVGRTPPDKGGARVVDNFEHWLAMRDADAPPAFAFLNFLEAHFPYHQTPPRFLARYTTLGPFARRDVSLKAMAAQFGRDLTDEEVAAISGPSLDMYDAGVAYTDFLLERVVDALRDAGRLESTLLVVLADHGEMLGEHREFGHGPALYEPDVRVPLLLRWPARIPAGERVARPVSTVGVYATVLDVVGLEAPRRPHVASLLPVIRGARGGDPVIAERFAMRGDRAVAFSAPLAMRDRRYRVYRRGSDKLAVTSKGDVLLFDLASDPGEEVNLAPRDTAKVAELQRELESWVAALGLPAIDAEVTKVAAPTTDPAAEERLRALGYLD